MAKKSSPGMSPILKLAHEKRRVESARIAKMSPAERTKEVAPKLVDAALRAIHKVGVLGSAKTVKEVNGENEYAPKFEVTAEQRARILSTLRHAVDQLDNKLNPGEGKKKTKTGFSF